MNANEVKEFCENNENSLSTTGSEGESNARVVINAYQERRGNATQLDDEEETKEAIISQEMDPYNPLVHKTIVPIKKMNEYMLFELLEAMLSKDSEIPDLYSSIHV